MDQSNRRDSRRGLLYILIATVIAGVAGYVIQGVTPAFIGAPEIYLLFSVFWSTLYLIIAALAGIQQELSRAIQPASGDASAQSQAHGEVLKFSAMAMAGVAVAMFGTGVLWAPLLFDTSWQGMLVALTVGVTSYVAIAVISGILYGLSIWKLAAATTIIDALIRLALVLAIGSTWSNPESLAWAVVIPFPVTAGIVWILTRRFVGQKYALDVPLQKLIRNSFSTVLGSVATGILTSGFAVVVRLATQGEDPGKVGALVFVLTLTRAPLIVPIMALQSFLTVQFRVRNDMKKILLRLSTMTALVGILVAFVAMLAVPWVIDLLWPEYTVSASVAFGTVLSAAATALLCISGPAVLSQAKHRAFVVGWLIAAMVMILLLWLPLPLSQRVLVAMTVGPLVGYATHLLSMGNKKNT